jgi:hypothetical protein
VVQRGLNWLRGCQKDDGSFTAERPFLYNEAIATTAFVEAFALTRNRYWEYPAERGLAFLQQAQKPSPSGTGRWGWRYDPAGKYRDLDRAKPENLEALYDADTSVTAWCVLALDAARRQRLSVGLDALDGASEFCRFVSTNTGLVGYLDAKAAGATVTGPFSDQFQYHPSAMTALGMCIRMFTEHDPDDPFLGMGAKRIVSDLPKVSGDPSTIDFYYWHFANLALAEFDGPDSGLRTGKYWDPWTKALTSALLNLQVHAENDCRSGGWIVNDRWGSWTGAGPLYSTAINVLTLESCFASTSAFGVSPLIGFEAPPIQLTDDRGTWFSLGTCRGRVVVLDFRTVLTDRLEKYVVSRKEVVDRFRNRPFLLLTLGFHDLQGVRLPTAAERGSESWLCTQLLEVDDPNVVRYELHGRPATIVVDAKGVVRGATRNWNPDVELIDQLVREAEETPK